LLTELNWQGGCRPAKIDDDRKPDREPTGQATPAPGFGGELKSFDEVEFANLSQLDIVGMYGNYAEAYTAWKEVAQRTVDNAHLRYFIVHLHRLLEPVVRRPHLPEGWSRAGVAFGARRW
jgi:hypothetical protein